VKVKARNDSESFLAAVAAQVVNAQYASTICALVEEEEIVYRLCTNAKLITPPFSISLYQLSCLTK